MNKARNSITLTNGNNLVKTLYVHYNVDEMELKWSDNYFDLASGD